MGNRADPLVIGWRVYVNVVTVNDAIGRCITACPLVSLSKIKPCQFSLVQLRRSVRAFNYLR